MEILKKDLEVLKTLEKKEDFIGFDSSIFIYGLETGTISVFQMVYVRQEEEQTHSINEYNSTLEI